MKTWYRGVLLVCIAIGWNVLRGSEPSASETEIKEQIRVLEEREVQAVLTRDASTLERLWDKGYVVHNPQGRIVLPGATVMDRPVFRNTRASFVREVESIVVQGGVVFSMGSETVIQSLDSAKSGEVIKRRYTNVWMRRDGVWKLVARHANEVCGGGSSDPGTQLPR